jgi:serine/threonine protein kinase
MGLVYRARASARDRIVALKVIRAGWSASAIEVTRFLIEAAAVAVIRHPNVVQLFECGLHDGRPYMALEYVPGGTLAGLLGTSSLPTPIVAELLTALSAGVRAAHEQGIVHRDLKPANVLLDETGVPKVTDFGLAKITGGENLTASGIVMGTPAYMAPEQAGGNSKGVGPSADVWALGAILYECLTGVRPFKGDATQTLLAQVLTGEPVPPRRLAPRTPRELELICLKCLAKRPHERYPTAKELWDDLDRFSRDEPITACL